MFLFSYLSVSRLFHRTIIIIALFSSSVVAVDNELEKLKEIVQADNFFDARFMDLNQMDIKRSALEYALMRELPKRVPVSVGNEKLSNFASNWVRKNSPRGLIEFCLEKKYKLQIHYGSTAETLFFLAKNKSNKAFHIFPIHNSGVEFVLRPAEGIKPGLIVVTGLRSKLQVFNAQLAFVHFRNAGKAYSAADILTYNFHLVDEEAYRSALFKESFINLPVGVKSALLGAGKFLLQEAINRKFAVQTIDLLKGLYGDKFLLPLKRDLIEEDFLGLTEWDIEIFKPLEVWAGQFLDHQNMILFQKFQKQLVLVLKQNKKHRLSQLLLVGNELTVSKNLVIKKKVLSKLLLNNTPDINSPYFSALLPVRTEVGVERILFVDDVDGDSIDSLIRVLESIGFSDFLYSNSAFSRNENMELGNVVSPGKVSLKSQVLENTSLSNSSFFRENLSLEQSYLPFNFSSHKGDLINPDAFHFLKVCQGQDLKHGLLLVTSNESQVQELKKVLINREILGKLVDPIFSYFRIKDILLEADESEFGFASLKEKVEHYNLRHGISNERSILFRYALDSFLDRYLPDEESRETYMRSPNLVPANIHLNTLNPLNYYLDKPFEDQDVIAHLLQVEKALEEMKVFLGLLGENSYKIYVHGDFLEAMFTPLSPLHITVTGISQKSLYELLSSPFGNQDHIRRFLVRVLPSGTDYGPQLEISQNLKKGGLEQTYMEILEKSGIRRTEEGLFEFFLDKSSDSNSQLKSKVNRYLRGCDAFMSLGRADFLREKSQIFSVAPWSNERVEELTVNLREGVSKLTSEGLAIKESLRKSSLSDSEAQGYMNQLNRKISLMDSFVQIFVNY